MYLQQQNLQVQMSTDYVNRKEKIRAADKKMIEKKVAISNTWSIKDGYMYKRKQRVCGKNSKINSQATEMQYTLGSQSTKELDFAIEKFQIAIKFYIIKESQERNSQILIRITRVF